MKTKMNQLLKLYTY